MYLLMNFACGKLLNLPFFYIFWKREQFSEFGGAKKFYQKYYQIILNKKFPIKETKLLLIGPSDSGKTSCFALFALFEGKIIRFS